MEKLSETVHTTCDPFEVERLVSTISDAMEHTCSDETAPAEIVSALFTILYRVLRAMQKLELPEDKKHNTDEIRRILMDMLMEFGAAEN